MFDATMTLYASVWGRHRIMLWRPRALVLASSPTSMGKKSLSAFAYYGEEDHHHCSEGVPWCWSWEACDDAFVLTSLALILGATKE